MKKLKKYFKVLPIFVLFLALFICCKKEVPSQESKPSAVGNLKTETKLNGKVEAKVIRVVDGDTIVVAIPKVIFNDNEAVLKDLRFNVRLIGVDTPESKENRRARIQAKENHTTVRVIVYLGKKAKEFTLEQLLIGKKGRKKIYKNIYLEFDKEPQDHYGRLLAYVWLPDGRMLNKMLICEGYAYPLTVKPNDKYEKEFLECYKKAKKEHKGLWKRDK